MRIELNTNRVERITPSTTQQPATAAASGSDVVQFSGSEALTQALAQVPETRPEVVERAKSLIGSSTYPPEELITRLSRLMASQLSQIKP